MPEIAAALAARSVITAGTGELPDRCLVFGEVQQIVRYSRVHVDRLEKQNLFPRRIHLGKGRVVWRASEIWTWIESKRTAIT